MVTLRAKDCQFPHGRRYTTIGCLIALYPDNYAVMTMLDLESAIRMAEDYIGQNACKAPLALFRELTIERDFGWVFFYGSNDPGIPIAGNAPLIVDRRDGSIHVTGTAYPTELYLESYERVGRTYPFATAEHLVVLDGWTPGLREILLTKLIQGAGRKKLIDAKRCTDELLAGRTIVLKFLTETDADFFSSQATCLGATSRRETRFN